MLTSCARSYVTWANEYAGGRPTLNGVAVQPSAGRGPAPPGAVRAAQQPGGVGQPAGADVVAAPLVADAGPVAPEQAAWYRRHAGGLRRPRFLHVSLRADGGGHPGALRRGPDRAARHRPRRAALLAAGLRPQFHDATAFGVRDPGGGGARSAPLRDELARRGDRHRDGRSTRSGDGAGSGAATGSATTPSCSFLVASIRTRDPTRSSITSSPTTAQPGAVCDW